MVLGSQGADTSRSAADLVRLVRPGDCWVVNDTRVRRARVHAVKAGSGGRVELLVTRTEGERAEVMVRSSKPLRPGQALICEATDDALTVLEAPGGGIAVVRLPADVEAFLGRAGQIPLPPYIDRAPEPIDAERYQTVYADQPGAVAAPTAGLHLTEGLMSAMADAGATFARVTLHVGPGTFRPIRAADVRDHRLQAEVYRVTEEAADAIDAARRVVAVGTTAVRTLETVACDSGPRRVEPGFGETGLYITPGHHFRAVDALLTNFHLPGSSLLVLVAALAGLERTRAAYDTAIAEGFRFYSYGDAMFIESSP